MTITRSGMTPVAIEEIITQRVTKVLAAQEANRAARLKVESQSQNGDEGNNNNGNRNGGRNGNNRNGNPNGGAGRDAPVAKVLTLPCPRMVPKEDDKAERYIWGLPDNVQGNVTSSKPVRLQDAIRMASSLMDQKMRTYAARSAKKKRKLDSNPRDNRVQPPPFKRQSVGGQNVARAYTARSNEKHGYAGSLPYYNKCKLHHEGQCTVKCNNFKKVGHMDIDCKAAVATQAPRSPVPN
ncbi:hypothetical protein Tco_0814951 [Tanacetum coccineum]